MAAFDIQDVTIGPLVAVVKYYAEFGGSTAVDGFRLADAGPLSGYVYPDEHPDLFREAARAAGLPDTGTPEELEEALQDAALALYR